MASYTEGINGPFTGKVASVIGTSNRGKAVMKGVGDIRIDNPTEAQLLSRDRLSTMTSFLTRISTVLQIGFPAKRTGLTSVNQAIKINMRNALDFSAPTAEINYPKLQIGKGSLPASYKPGIQVAGNFQVRFFWDHFPMSNPNDLVTILCYCPALNNAHRFINTAKRSALEFSANLGDAFLDKEIHSWILFSNGTIASNSMYLGKLIVT
ncbi:DUF6266 family protein [Pedobacter duraquae]|uniref:Uncharacterized protein n=1 Tax=Pedobacter duraquae TaxID=425511 RepID=A0A4R6INZ1_9SPHI|nr:DUF6266 family protein [Pedobacter duraquae]TDO23989.1 hypothetical protein CLV32_0276 [Pedobacter duraquae]